MFFEKGLNLLHLVFKYMVLGNIKSIFSGPKTNKSFSQSDWLALEKELICITGNVVNYLLNNNVNNLVLLDRSARAFYAALYAWYDFFHPDKPKPNVYFINPDFKSEKKLKHEFRGGHPYLYEKRDKPVLVLDTCCHSGNKLSRVKKLLTKVGFSDVRYRIMTVDDEEPANIDYNIAEIAVPRKRGCYTIGQDWLVEKGNKVTSKRDHKIDPEVKRISFGNRKYLRDVIERFYLANFGTKEGFEQYQKKHDGSLKFVRNVI